jgi:mono/diheme cytochrome c family protein
MTPTSAATETSVPEATATAGAEGTPDTTVTEPSVASDLTWDRSIGPMLQERCGTCHGAGALGGLNLTTYETALEGGTSGDAIVPGDSEASLLVQIQQSGDHPAVLTPEELAQVIEWIDAGAPQN